MYYILMMTLAIVSTVNLTVIAYVVYTYVKQQAKYSEEAGIEYMDIPDPVGQQPYPEVPIYTRPTDWSERRIPDEFDESVEVITDEDERKRYESNKPRY